jgi:hypothetical protein
MSFNSKRYRMLDACALAAFIVAIVGVSLAWWKAKAPSGASGELLSAFGLDMSSLSLNGWKKEVSGTGRTTFVLMLIALVPIVAKALLPAGSAPSWYKESWILLGIGGLSSLLGILGCLIPPEGGYEYWTWGVGPFITLVASLAFFGLGYLMLKDRTGAYDGQGAFKLPAIGGQPSSTEGK